MRLSILLVALSTTTTTTFAFTIPTRSHPSTQKTTFQTHKLHSSSLEQQQQDQETQSTATAVRAPLKYIGPYPTLPLHFPTLSTSSQRTRNETGISLDFILDTAANTNTINAQVASELQLPKVGKSSKGVGAAGVMEGGGDTFLLGDCELEGLKKEERFTFMTGLTASALPVASPAAAGLLSLAFLNCFEGGVEFNWGTTTSSDAGSSTAPPDGDVEAAIIPAVTFYSDNNDKSSAKHALLLEGMQSTKIKPLEGTGLPIITLHINNGIAIPALLDTGSPVTVVNEEAAALAGIQWEKKEKKESNMNPFARIAKNWKMAQAAARGDVLLVAGGSGERVELVKSEQPVRVTLGDDDDDEDESIDFGQNHVYVGNLPGLAALENYFGEEKNKNKSAVVPPAAMLGMDIIRTKPRMVYRADEVFF